MLLRFKQLFTKDPDLTRVQLNVNDLVNQLALNPFLTGVTMSATITAAAKAFNHKLGRQPLGWIILDNQANAVIWRTAWTPTTITLQGSNPTTASFWIF